LFVERTKMSPYELRLNRSKLLQARMLGEDAKDGWLVNSSLRGYCHKVDEVKRTCSCEDFQKNWALLMRATEQRLVNHVPELFPVGCPTQWAINYAMAVRLVGIAGLPIFEGRLVCKHILCAYAARKEIVEDEQEHSKHFYQGKE
jgi:hypothetical protein